MFLKKKISEFTNPYLKVANELKTKINEADKIIIGAGSGLSTSAGMSYDGARCDKYFWDFKERFGIQDMYSGGFYTYIQTQKLSGLFGVEIFGLIVT